MENKICPHCGYSLSSYYKTGYLNCPTCYTHFRVEIENTLDKIQGGKFHVGKKPSFNGVDRQLLEEYENLLLERSEVEQKIKSGNIIEINEDILGIEEELKKRGLIK